eukprot:403333914
MQTQQLNLSQKYKSTQQVNTNGNGRIKQFKISNNQSRTQLSQSEYNSSNSDIVDDFNYSSSKVNLENNQEYDKTTEQTANPNKLLARFNPNPSHHIQKKIEYFILPYNQQIQSQKHMKFEEEKDVVFDLQILSNESLNQKHENIDIPIIASLPQQSPLKSPQQQKYIEPIKSKRDQVQSHSYDLKERHVYWSGQSGWMKLHEAILNQEQFMFDSMIDHIKKAKDLSQIRNELQKRNKIKKARTGKNKPRLSRKLGIFTKYASNYADQQSSRKNLMSLGISNSRTRLTAQPHMLISNSKTSLFNQNQIDQMNKKVKFMGTSLEMRETSILEDDSKRNDRSIRASSQIYQSINQGNNLSINRSLKQFQNNDFGGTADAANYAVLDRIRKNSLPQVNGGLDILNPPLNIISNSNKHLIDNKSDWQRGTSGGQYVLLFSGSNQNLINTASQIKVEESRPESSEISSQQKRNIFLSYKFGKQSQEYQGSDIKIEISAPADDEFILNQELDKQIARTPIGASSFFKKQQKIRHSKTNLESSQYYISEDHPLVNQQQQNNKAQKSFSKLNSRYQEEIPDILLQEFIDTDEPIDDIVSLTTYQNGKYKSHVSQQQDNEKQYDIETPSKKLYIERKKNDDTNHQIFKSVIKNFETQNFSPESKQTTSESYKISQQRKRRILSQSLQVSPRRQIPKNQNIISPHYQNQFNQLNQPGSTMESTFGGACGPYLYSLSGFENTQNLRLNKGRGNMSLRQNQDINSSAIGPIVQFKYQRRNQEILRSIEAQSIRTNQFLLSSKQPDKPSNLQICNIESPNLPQPQLYLINDLQQEINTPTNLPKDLNFSTLTNNYLPQDQENKKLQQNGQRGGNNISAQIKNESKTQKLGSKNLNLNTISLDLKSINYPFDEPRTENIVKSKHYNQNNQKNLMQILNKMRRSSMEAFAKEMKKGDREQVEKFITHYQEKSIN